MTVWSPPVTSVQDTSAARPRTRRPTGRGPGKRTESVPTFSPAEASTVTISGSTRLVRASARYSGPPPVAASNRSSMSWVTSTQPLVPRSRPTAARRPSRDSITGAGS